MGFIFGPGTDYRSVEQLVADRNRMARQNNMPSSAPQDAWEGAYAMAQALRNRFDRNRLDRRIEQLDPTGEVVAALMGRAQ